MVALKQTDDIQRILLEDGTLAPGAQAPDLNKAEFEKIFRALIMVRVMDERMMRLQRTGQLSFYMTSTGEEATHMAVAALRDGDWIYPSYREPGAAFYRGYTAREFLNQLYGNCDDAAKGRQMPVHHTCRRINFVSISSPVGTQIPQATGTAMAAKISGKDDVAICYFGEGTSSEGDFHTGINFAGAFKAPAIFIIRNNGYAISTSAEVQTAAKTLVSRAAGYGIPGVRIDGNDLLAVLQATKEAARRARAGEGPTLIEACTFRVGAHSSSDDPSAYRDESQAEEWKRRDPLVRLRKYFGKQGMWSEQWEQQLHDAIDKEVLEATEHARGLPVPQLDTLFDEVYEELPRHLVEQKEWLMKQPRAKNPHVH